MEKIGVDTALAIFFVAFAVVVIGGLVVIPAFEEAEAACEGFKNNGDPCKDKNQRKTSRRI